MLALMILAHQLRFIEHKIYIHLYIVNNLWPNQPIL